MISKETLTTAWIEKVSRASRNADRILVEKVIRSLLLVEGLVQSGLPFTFKGGTALMLLMKSAKRLSIDVDIVISETPKNLDDLLRSFAAEKGFTKVELQHRATESNIEKAHYKFFYAPVHKTNAAEEAVLLDILFEANHYRAVAPHDIESPFIINSGKPAQVNIPSLEDLLGDKLTAFAPNTTGIPYFKKDVSMSMEIIKQLYDIGSIFDVVDDLDVIRTTFYRIAETEIAYRNLKNAKPADVLEDIYQTSLCISLRGKDGKGDFEQLQQGIERVIRFVFSESYHLEKAIPHAAKAAYLSRLIASDKKAIEKFEDPAQVRDATIEAPHNTRLQKLKKSSPEAFFYWWKAVYLLR